MVDLSAASWKTCLQIAAMFALNIEVAYASWQSTQAVKIFSSASISVILCRLVWNKTDNGSYSLQLRTVSEWRKLTDAKYGVFNHASRQSSLVPFHILILQDFGKRGYLVLDSSNPVVANRYHELRVQPLLIAANRCLSESFDQETKRVHHVVLCNLIKLFNHHLQHDYVGKPI